MRSMAPFGSHVSCRVTFVVAQTVEGHDARVLLTGRRVPGDALVGGLLDDLGVELAGDTGDRHLPVGVSVIDLAHRVDAGHELGEGLELRPLVVDGGDGEVDVDLCSNSAHGVILSLVSVAVLMLSLSGCRVEVVDVRSPPR